MKKLSLWSPSTPITHSQHVKCVWCVHNVNPGPEGICSKCHQYFKRLLCGSRWQKLRRNRLATFDTAFCADPFNCHPVPIPGEQIDHRLSWRYAPSLFWEGANHQTLCRPCHQKKTGIDGSFNHSTQKRKQ